jgi:hypothetical protein
VLRGILHAKWQRVSDRVSVTKRRRSRCRGWDPEKMGAWEAQV